MELIEDSKKSLYEKCKLKVKIWEHQFKKNNGRLPSKLDIKEASPEVRNAYKTYFNLKTAALEQSFMDVDGFNSDEEPKMEQSESMNTTNTSTTPTEKSVTKIPDSTWGLHLNNIPKKDKTDKPTEPAPNMNLKITRKLSMGSKLIKRNPRKSLGHVKSESSINLSSKNLESSAEMTKSFSQPTHSEPLVSPAYDFELETLNFNSKNLKIVSANKNVLSQPISLINKVLDENIEKNTKLKNVDIEWLKRVEISTKLNIEAESVPTKLDDFVSDEDIIDNSDDECSRSTFHIVKKIKYNNSRSTSIKSNSLSETFESCCQNSSKCAGNSESSDFPEVEKVVVNNKPPSFDNLSRSEKNQQDFNNGKSEEYSKLKLDNFVNNINVSLSNKENTHVNEEEIKTCEMRSIIPGKNKEKIIVVKSKSDEFDEELLAKFKKKNLNENFVRINIQKKVYARGKKTQTFSKFKKKLWKSKKDFLANRHDDSGATKNSFKSAKLLPLDSTVLSEDEDNLLTLDQASGKDIQPNLNVDNNEPKDEQESDDDNISLAELRRKIKGANDEEIRIDATELNTLTKKKRTSRKTVSNKNTKPTVRKTRAVSERNKVSVNTREEIEEEDALHSNINEHLFDPDDDLDLFLETIRIEEKLNLQEVRPLYSLKDDGSLKDTSKEVLNALKLFGHDSFRKGQEQAVMRILSGSSTLVTLSTGSGKSMCYQLPAYLFRQKYRCITLVVSPLISLMEDQINCIPGVLNAACLHGNQSKTQRDTIIKAVASGDVHVLMVSPESILSSENSSGFGSVLAKLPPIAFACLDEAHCLSQWSHNFRPSYLVVCRILQETLGVKTILGLTATATKATRNSLIEQLKIPDGEKGVIRDTPVPVNLSLSISKDANKDQALLELLLSEPFVDFKSIIIYCLRRDECEKVATFLRTTLKDYQREDSTKKRKRMSLQAEPYHAGLTGARRKSIQKAFMSGELRIVVATIAFGMGINKSDLRSVIHYNMPAKFESYVQEIGRAGRDGLPAHCHVFLDKRNADILELRRHIYGNSVDRHIIRKLLRNVFVSCTCEGVCFKHEVMFSMDSTVQSLDIPKEIISTLLCYLELHEKKYIKILKPAFGKCKVISYGGRALIVKMAESCEVLKAALKMYGNDEENSNNLEFPILKVCRKLNWDSGMCKRILKNLEWTNVNGVPKRSGISVELTDLCFHLLSPGNLPDEDLDEVLDTLYNKVLEQENSAYSQLIHISDTLSKVARHTFKDALDDTDKSEILKTDIREYFESDKALEWAEIPEISEQDKCVVLSDIRSIVSRFSDENFTGRSIARIFHGIPSPNFPPYVWGKTKFWRSHLQVHFNVLCKLASSELIKFHK